MNARAWRDPVCGMTVKADSPHGVSLDGIEYRFCGAGCRTKFVADPARYLAPPPAPGDAALPHTCPMHPEVTQLGPGSCPVCGMALEPAVPGVDDGEPAELSDFRQRWLWTLPMTFAVAVLGMSTMHGPHAVWSSWAQLALSVPVVMWAGQPILTRAWHSLVTRHFNMWTLIGLGVASAFGMSVIATAAPALLPHAWFAHASTPIYFESAVVIISLTLLGQILELKARMRAADALRALLALAPPCAHRIDAAGGERDVPLADIRVGDQVRVRPGEQVPVDGRVIDGASAVDEALVSGESVPVMKGVGARVIGGSVNSSGTLVIRATAIGAETVLARIVALVAQAQRSKAPLQRLADRVAAHFVVAVMACALATFCVWTLWGPAPGWQWGLLNAIAVLVIACPCALGLATPMSITVATARAARAGVLFRDAAALERLAAVDVLVVDKTGTLTAGRPELVSLHPAPGMSEARLLELAASVEQASEHPYARAVRVAATTRGVTPATVNDFAAEAGFGVRGLIDGMEVVLGNRALLARHGIALDVDNDALRRDGAVTLLHLAADRRYAGCIAVGDKIKPTAKAALAALRGAGLDIVIATGDAAPTAQLVAGELGIEQVHAALDPGAKLALIGQLQQAGHVVAMAGDGVNDAPALARADVGIAMGSGADVALLSAPVTLLESDLRAIERAYRLAQATRKNMRQNLAFAFAYNALGVPLAAGVLYPLTGWLLSPMVAALAMSLSSVCVITNALRLSLSRM